MPGKNQTTIGAYTIPAGITSGLIKNPFFHAGRASTSSGTSSVQCTLRISSYESSIWSAPRVKRDIDITIANGNDARTLEPVNELDDILLTVQNVSNNNTFVSGGFRLILYRD